MVPCVVCMTATKGRAAFFLVKSGRPLKSSNGIALVKPQPGPRGAPCDVLPGRTVTPAGLACAAGACLAAGTALAETAPPRVATPSTAAARAMTWRFGMTWTFLPDDGDR